MGSRRNFAYSVPEAATFSLSNKLHRRSRNRKLNPERQQRCADPSVFSRLRQRRISAGRTLHILHINQHALRHIPISGESDQLSGRIQFQSVFLKRGIPNKIRAPVGLPMLSRCSFKISGRRFSNRGRKLCTCLAFDDVIARLHMNLIKQIITTGRAGGLHRPPWGLLPAEPIGSSNLLSTA